MDKLKSWIKTLTKTEVSHFKSFLKQKSKGQSHKKEKLFTLLYKGVAPEEARDLLYSSKESKNAYYQLRKTLIDDLELFLVVECVRHNSENRTIQNLLLAEQAKHRGNTDLAISYYHDMIELAEISCDEELKAIGEKSISDFTEFNHKLLYVSYKEDIENASVNRLLKNYPISFYTNLSNTDLKPFFELVTEHELTKKFDNQAYKQLFLTNYCLFRFKFYEQALDGIDHLQKLIALDESSTDSILIWSQLLKPFIYAKLGLIEKAFSSQHFFDSNYFEVIGTQYQLLMLRWRVILHVNYGDSSTVTPMAIRLLSLKDELKFHIGRSETVKLYIYMADLMKDLNKTNIYNQLLKAIRDLIEESDEEKSKALLNRFLRISLIHKRIFKSPEDIAMNWLEQKNNVLKNNLK
ncbi:MAG: hypothetical protein ACJAUV_001370 [Flavobacteriales bacterium]|jgi:hypothetical protein